jgi:hypothetical protein
VVNQPTSDDNDDDDDDDEEEEEEKEKTKTTCIEGNHQCESTILDSEILKTK